MNFIFEGNAEYQIKPEHEQAIGVHDDLWEYQRLATKYKEQKNWDLALACLYVYKTKMEQKKFKIEVEQLLRFPLFLQQAGLFEEAKNELGHVYDYIYLSTPVIQISEFTDQNSKIKEELLAKHSKLQDLGYFYDKARLIYQRGKKKEEAEELKKLSEKYLSEADEVYGKYEEIEDEEEFQRTLEEIGVDDEYSEEEESSSEVTKNNNKLSPKEIFETIVGFCTIALIVWGIVKIFD